MNLDTRDEALAGVLDEAVRHVDPAPDRLPEVRRRGVRRRLAALAAALAVVTLFVSAVIGAALLIRDDRVDAPTPAGSGPDLTRQPEEWTEAQDPRGWTIGVPPSWLANRQEHQCRVTEQGIVVANVPLAGLSPPATGSNDCPSPFALSALPTDAVVVEVEHSIGGSSMSPVPPGEETPFPLSLEDFGSEAATVPFNPLVLEVVVDDGWRHTVRVYLGLEVTDDDRRIAEEVVASIRPFGSGPAEDVTAGLLTYRDEVNGFTVTYPESWLRAEENLMPNLSDPHQILALATYPMRVGGDSCAHVPVNALVDLGPTDALIDLEEEEGRVLDSIPVRPQHFGPDLGGPSEAIDCVESQGGSADFEEQWFYFQDQGRMFYVRVAFGEQVSPETRQQAYDILDSLVFDPAE
jgi:hypothetical protein